MATVRLQGISKDFGDVRAVDNISFEVAEGEFFSLLGPSGCGKTTTLRMLAGFENPSSGSIFINGKDVTATKPQERHVGMVFQNYALFAHLSVGENVAFGLKARKVEKSHILPRVVKALQRVELTGFENRAVSELSGGQQQRVALARALVIEPQILLLDEPLSNLDAKLRVETREQIRELQKKLGITTFYVTHDQEEALTQSDRIAVFFSGRCVQIGSPRDIFNNPQTQEVMAFLGRANFLDAEIVKPGVAQLDGEIKLKLDKNEMAAGTKITLGLRPHQVELFTDEPTFSGEIAKITYTGAFEEILIRAGELTIEALLPNGAGDRVCRIGDTVPVKLLENSLVIFMK
ncbi:MAG: ABC transporter ATP-binding protein [Calditrichaeota bacterium]|nr:MAG: ABC transporter ATP-binding protein [Calditrichota bacterium]